MSQERSRESASVEQPAADAWKVYDHTEFNYQLVEPYTVINGITTMRAFTVVEHAICAKIRPSEPRYRPMPDPRQEALRVMAHEPILFAAPIEEKLRPARFNGNIQDGTVVILPFDPDLAAAHNSRVAATAVQERPSFTVMYQGVLRAGGKQLGEMLLDTTYFAREAREKSIKRQNLVRRTLGTFAMKPIETGGRST